MDCVAGGVVWVRSSWVSVSGLCVLLAYFSIFTLGLSGIADDPGLGWHLADGAQILQRGEIPHRDPFLARALIPNRFAPVGEGRAWISDQWLSDVIFVEILKVGDWPLLYALVIGLFVTAFFGSALSLNKGHSGQGVLLIFLATLLAFKVGQVHMIVRPVIFSIFLFSVVLSRATRLLALRVMGIRELLFEGAFLVPLFILWANLHPAFVYGLLVLGLCCFIFTLRAIALGIRCAALFVVCLLSTLINPYGWNLHRSILQLGQSAYLRSMTAEWNPMSLTSTEGVYLLILALVPLMSALLVRKLRVRIGLFEVLVSFIFVAQALYSVRIAPFAALACLPLWGTCFGAASILPKYRIFNFTNQVLCSVFERESRLKSPGLAASCVLAGAVIIGSMLIPERMLPWQLGSNIERKIDRIFEGVKPPEGGGVILSSLSWGGAITRRLGESFKPVLDDRTVLVGEELYRAYEQMSHASPVFEELVRVFGVTHILTDVSDPLFRSLSTDSAWRVVYSDGVTALLALQSLGYTNKS